MASRRGTDINLDIDMSTLLRGADELNRRLDIGVAGVVKQRSHIAVGWMKENATWTDRTGNARAGLDAVTEHVPFVRHSIVLLHKVAYGIWLEVRFGGRYAIIIPAMIDQGPKMMFTLNKLFRRLKAGG